MNGLIASVADLLIGANPKYLEALGLLCFVVGFSCFMRVTDYEKDQSGIHLAVDSVLSVVMLMGGLLAFQLAAG